MTKAWSVIFCSALLGFVGNASAATTEPPKTTDRVLAAMDRTPTEGHPDQFNEFAGMHRYANADYKAAMKYFLVSARYADKLSQLSIGLMYLNGQGVKKDPVTAFAWIAIAAERKYPQFLLTRDQVWAQLDDAQRVQAKALVTSLYEEYGDTVAKPRMALALRQGLIEETGLGLGYDKSGDVTSQSLAYAPPPNCSKETIEGATQTGCGDIYADTRWDPKVYFRVRDAAWNGTVTVGPLQDLSRTPKAKNGH